MDPLTVIAGKVVAYLAPLAIDKGVALGMKTGKDLVNKLGDWLDSLRVRWAEDTEATEALAQFEAAPTKKAARLTEVLTERMNKDHNLKDSAEKLTKILGPLIIVNMKGGEVDVQEGPNFESIRSGRVLVDIQLDKGKIQTGGNYGPIG